MTALEVTSVVDVSEADVYKAGQRAARLTRTPDGVRFTYLEGYGGPPVATTLALDARPVRRPGGALPAYFTGLLPEGRRLGALRRAVKTSVDDELSLLLAVGADTIGDVQVVPAGAEVPRTVARVQLSLGGLSYRDLLAELDLVPDRTGLPGVQDKVSAAMITVPVARSGGAYILKLDPPEYPGLVANESVLLRACARSGLTACDAELIRDDEGSPGLAVMRFDRLPNADGSLRPLAVEDGCQVQNRSPGDKYIVGYAATFQALAAVCDARLLAVRTLLAQLVFAILTGNGDAHAKNFSVLQQPDGEWRVSPAYDVPTSHPYGDTTLAMAVNGRRSDAGAVDVIALGTATGLPAVSCRRVLRRAVDQVDGWLPLLDELPYDRRRRDKLVRVVRQRQSRLTP